jgi:hypothetical protein
MVSFRGHLLKEAQDLCDRKAADYASPEDVLSNFRRLAADLGVRPEQVWVIYFRKQVDALVSWAAKGRLESEPLRSRFQDVINYCVLGAALAAEAEQ